MKGQMDGWHGDEEELSAYEAKQEDFDYEKWIFSRYFLHQENNGKTLIQEFKNEQNI